MKFEIKKNLYFFTNQSKLRMLPTEIDETTINSRKFKQDDDEKKC